MTDYERGPSSPETPLAFDPRRPVRGAGPVPATLVISAVILISLVGAVAFVYRGGVRHPSGPPAQVGAPVGDFKAPAPAETPGPDATAGLTIYKTNGPAPDMGSASPTLAPPPEQVQPRPREVAAGPPPPPPPPAVTTKAAAPSAIASLADAAANGPAALPTTASPAPNAAVPPAAKGAGPPPGAGWVQIGAFSSPALADKGWTAVARLEPAAMAGKGKHVEPTDKDGQTIYRTYITGFSSKAAAQAFCDRLKADQGACIVK